MLVHNKFNRGFTLLELLIVVAMIGVLASVVAITSEQSRIKGDNARNVSQIGEYIKALNYYEIEFDEYPNVSYTRVCFDVNDNVCGIFGGEAGNGFPGSGDLVSAMSVFLPSLPLLPPVSFTYGGDSVTGIGPYYSCDGDLEDEGLPCTRAELGYFLREDDQACGHGAVDLEEYNSTSGWNENTVVGATWCVKFLK